MFGLSFEKLLLVAVVAGVIVGPQRLPAYAQKLAETIRSLRAFLDAARAQAERELGVPLAGVDLDPRQFDPRRIVREALVEPVRADPAPDREILEEAAQVRPGQKYLVTGSAAHPKRVPIDSLPAGDPRRLAALTKVPSTPDVEPDRVSADAAGLQVAAQSIRGNLQ